MNSFLAMVIANLKMTIRNRQAIFWNLAFPAIFILVFGAVFGNDSLTSFDIGIVGAETQTGQQLMTGFESVEAFNLHTGTETDELKALDENDRQVVLVIPETVSPDAPIGFYYNEQGGPTDSIAEAAVQNAIFQILGDPSAVPLNMQPYATQDISFIDFFVPGILAMSIMNSGIIGLSTAFTSFREKGILRRIKVTPFALWKFILARIVSQIFVILATSAILMLLAKLVWGLTVRGNWLLIILVILIGSMAFLAIGYAISSIARNTEAAASYANLITFPMLFLSGVFFSVGAMPGWLQPIISILPLRYLVDALRDPIMYGRGLSDIWVELLVLIGIFVVAMAFAIRFFRWDATNR